MSDIIFELSQEIENIPLPVKGEIPFWLSGILVRNGPVQFSIDNQQVKHWFDGLGMLHVFSFDEGKVKYSNKFLRSDAFHAVTKEGTFNYVGFACDPCRTLFMRLMTFFFPSKTYPLQNANINVTKIAEQCVALYETPLPVRFDPKTLKTLGVFDFKDDLVKNSCFESAHPHCFFNETINYIVEYGLRSKYILYRILKGSNERQIIAEIPVENPSYMHSFAVTPHYIILVEFPIVANSLSFLIKNLPFIKNYHWKPERGTRFCVVEIKTGEIVFQEKTDPFFAFHHVNAFERGKSIALDIITYPDASIIDELAHHSYMDLSTRSLLKGAENFPTVLKRFTLSTDTKKITTEIIFDAVHELPFINSAYDGKSYRFVYAADVRKPNLADDVRKIYKIDVETKDILSWQEEQCYPGEPVFIPDPKSDQEDGGYLLVILMNLQTAKSFLLCLDAQNLQEVGRAEIPHQIPQGLHGQYFV